MSSVESGDVQSLRMAILSEPEIVLDDPQVLQALMRAEDTGRGANVIDLRHLAMSRLQDRLGQMRDAHQQVIEAAFENVATTGQVHRAILDLLRPLDFDGFLAVLEGDVADCLRLRAIRLVLERDDSNADCLLNRLDGVISLLSPEAVAAFADTRRQRPVLLRGVAQGNRPVYGTAAAEIRSEALVRLDMGPERAPGLLVLGADTAEHFVPGQATDLLELFARVCERLLRGWLG